MDSEDKQKLADYVLDPINGPNPSEETGLNTHFGNIGRTETPTSMEAITEQKKKPKAVVTEIKPKTSPPPTNPFRRNMATAHQRHSSAPPQNAIPTSAARPASSDGKTLSPTTTSDTYTSFRPRRAVSLSCRYPGDRSHRPLAILTAEARIARRAPHLTKQHLPGADSIDKLDQGALHTYHHEGPYDAALLARNTRPESSPVAAVARSNAEALRATPRESIRDAIEKHHPLDNTAMIPPGVPDQFGRVLHYEEGSNMQIENGGDYKRWPGVEYRPGDVKGHGEPGWDAGPWGVKGEGEARRRGGRYGDKSRKGKADYELQEGVGRRSSDRESGDSSAVATQEGKRASGEFKRRLGSLRRKAVVA